MRPSRCGKTATESVGSLNRRLARLIFCAAIITGLMLAANQAGAQSKLDPAKPELTMCKGPFALCSASTCKLTAKQFPEPPTPGFVCKSPALPGRARADLTGEKIKETSLPPVDPATKKAGVWSLFWPNLNIPQEVNGVWRRN